MSQCYPLTQTTPTCPAHLCFLGVAGFPGVPGTVATIPAVGLVVGNVGSPAPWHAHSCPQTRVDILARDLLSLATNPVQRGERSMRGLEGRQSKVQGTKVNGNLMMLNFTGLDFD